MDQANATSLVLTKPPSCHIQLRELAHQKAKVYMKTLTYTPLPEQRAGRSCCSEQRLSLMPCMRAFAAPAIVKASMLMDTE